MDSTMRFYTATNLQRPVRLSEETRSFAFESLHHKYGKETRKTPNVPLDHIENFSELTELEKYNAAIEEIVKKAPIRICPGEKVSGAATLGDAIRARVPATYKGELLFIAPNHLTIDFAGVVKYGVNKIRDDALDALEKHRETEQEAFAKSCIHCLECFDIWHTRYMEALKTHPGCEKNYENLKRVPMKPPRSFYEAVQSIWFVFAFVRLCGYWPGIGRIDEMLGPYLKKDLAEGLITLDEAREILAHLFIKGCEWITGEETRSGDAQHYQNIVLAGIAEDGEEVTNEVTYLVLDILEELGISDFPTTIRLNAHSDERLLRRAAEVVRFGGGILAFYDEDSILESLEQYGYSQDEARNFANDGCWEIQVPGKTFFNYSPFDALYLLQHRTLKDYSGDVDFNDFQGLYDQFVGDLQREVEGTCFWLQKRLLQMEGEQKGYLWKKQVPCTVISLFEQGCIAKGLSYLEGGPIYNIYSPHIGGLPDVVNSLYAIKKLVFDEKKCSFREFMDVLRNNWQTAEELRQYVKKYRYYGNDNDEVDAIAADLVTVFAESCSSQDGKCGLSFPAGISTFGRQGEECFLGQRLASPHGHKRGEVLAGNMSPTPGSDKEGATAIIRSYCKADMRQMVSGAALDVRLLPGIVKGESGVEALMALLKGFVTLGGSFMQMDVVDATVLKEAQKHPENYQTLSVRVSGWNARFVTMSKEWQNMLIREVEKS